jgi:hypothetical protein
VLPDEGPEADALDTSGDLKLPRFDDGWFHEANFTQLIALLLYVKLSVSKLP